MTGAQIPQSIAWSCDLCGTLGPMRPLDDDASRFYVDAGWTFAAAPVSPLVVCPDHPPREAAHA